MDDKMDRGRRPITRRDFSTASRSARAGSPPPRCCRARRGRSAGAGAAPETAATYPPLRTGLRGSHPGSFEQAHILRDGGHPGAGGAPSIPASIMISSSSAAASAGLSAAHFFREAKPRGAHPDPRQSRRFRRPRQAQRVPPGRLAARCSATAARSGSTAPIRTARRPTACSRRIGVDVAAHEEHREGRLLRLARARPRHLLRQGRRSAPIPRRGADKRPLAANCSRSAPLSETAERDIATIEAGRRRLAAGPHLRREEGPALADELPRLSRRLREGIDPQALAYFQPRSQGWWGVGIDAIAAIDAWGMGFPGFEGLKLDKGGIPIAWASRRAAMPIPAASYTLHFPDGNATIARLLVRALIPDALPGTSAADSVTARADYAKLDRPGQPVRIRLSSIVVAVHHQGDPAYGQGVDITYVTGTALRTVHAAPGRDGVVEHDDPVHRARAARPAEGGAARTGQGAARLYQRRDSPTGRPSIGSRSARIYAPGCYLHRLGAQRDGRCRRLCDARAIRRSRRWCGMEHIPCMPGLPEFDQNRAGRAELLATPFEEFEHHVRDEMGRALAGGGFDPDRDITAITVNRWPHGYAPEFNPLVGRGAARSAAAQRDRAASASAASPSPMRTPGGGAYTSVAIDQAHRAVGELLG